MDTKLSCDRCGRFTKTILVYKRRGDTPLLVCRRCYATLDLIKAGWKPKKTPYYRRWQTRTGYHKKELMMTNEDGSRGGVINQIDRNNSPQFKLTLYENGEKVGYRIYSTRASAHYERHRWLDTGTTYKKGNDGGITIVSEKDKEYKKKNAKQLAYIRKYNDQVYRQFNLKLNKVSDYDIIEELDTSRNKIETIREWYNAWIKEKRG